MATEYDVLSEIDVLQSIYLDELHVTNTCDRSWEVSLVLYPSTAEDSVSQFVRLTLTLTIDQQAGPQYTLVYSQYSQVMLVMVPLFPLFFHQYPFSSPSISIQNPRGLSDDMLSSVRRCLQTEAESCLGSPVLYQLIEKAKELLTESNIPHGNCVICLYGFKEGEAFTKTTCYHYFHSHCLGRYVTHSEGEIREREQEREQDKTRNRAEQQELTVTCPVCREPLTYDAHQLISSPAPLFPKLEGAEMGADFHQKWRELQQLLERQRAKGGIIDPDLESNRFLIHTNEVPSEAENAPPGGVVPPSQSVPLASAAPSDEVAPRAEPSHAVPWHCRGGAGHRRQGPFKGPRRGGRGRPQHTGRPSPPTESLNKLHLPSEGRNGPSPEAPIEPKPYGQRKAGESEPAPPERGREAPAGLSRPSAPPESTDTQQIRHQARRPGVAVARELQKKRCAVQTNWAGEGAVVPESHNNNNNGNNSLANGRRGTSRERTNGTLWGGWHHPWEGRGSRGRGGGPHRGHSRGSRQKTVERDVGREGVL